jgi:hypothetical protein
VPHRRTKNFCSILKKSLNGKELALYRVESKLYGTFRNLKAAVIKHMFYLRNTDD